LGRPPHAELSRARWCTSSVTRGMDEPVSGDGATGAWMLEMPLPVAAKLARRNARLRMERSMPPGCSGTS
jgi:hypothetical protein